MKQVEVQWAGQAFRLGRCGKGGTPRLVSTEFIIQSVLIVALLCQHFTVYDHIICHHSRKASAFLKGFPETDGNLQQSKARCTCTVFFI
jgi:hypothetical protein